MQMEVKSHRPQNPEIRVAIHLSLTPQLGEAMLCSSRGLCADAGMVWGKLHAE